MNISIRSVILLFISTPLVGCVDFPSFSLPEVTERDAVNNLLEARQTGDTKAPVALTIAAFGGVDLEATHADIDVAGILAEAPGSAHSGYGHIRIARSSSENETLRFYFFRYTSGEGIKQTDLDLGSYQFDPDTYASTFTNEEGSTFLYFELPKDADGNWIYPETGEALPPGRLPAATGGVIGLLIDKEDDTASYVVAGVSYDDIGDDKVYRLGADGEDGWTELSYDGQAIASEVDYSEHYYGTADVTLQIAGALNENNGDAIVYSVLDFTEDGGPTRRIEITSDQMDPNDFYYTDFGNPDLKSLVIWDGISTENSDASASGTMFDSRVTQELIDYYADDANADSDIIALLNGLLDPTRQELPEGMLHIPESLAATFRVREWGYGLRLIGGYAAWPSESNQQ